MNSLFDNINTRRQLLQLSEVPGVAIPDYVGEYTPLDKEAASKLPEQLFADPDLQEYPTDTKAATWLSAGLFSIQKTAGELTYTPSMAAWVWSNIEKAASIFEISDDIRAVKTACDATLDKTAAPDDAHYGWLLKDASGAVVARRYPMFDTDGVLKAAIYFVENRHQYPQEVRKEICSNILRKSAEFGVPDGALPDAIMREAGHGIPRTAVVMREIMHRARMCKDAEAGLALLNLNHVLAVADPQEITENLDKLAGIIEDFDHIEDLHGAYDRRVTYPADFLYGVSLKAAEASLSDTVMLAETAFSKSALAELDPAVALVPVLGADFVDKVATDGTVDSTKLACALEGLSQADQHALVAHLRIAYA